MPWQLIADSLRQELAEYGDLLRLFEAQQKSLFARDPGAVLQLGSQIEEQVRVLQDCRTRREEVVAAFAREHGEPAQRTVRALLPHIEADAHPLIEALVNEINRLVHRVRRTSHHNHTLLTRALELHQEMLRELRPGAFSKTYAPNGRISLSGTPASSALLAAG
jgi:flagellar biosynthesis/type III secretory pathway chaperone